MHTQIEHVLYLRFLNQVIALFMILFSLKQTVTSRYFLPLGLF